MARRRSASILAKMARAAAQERKRRETEATKAAKDAEKARKAYARAVEIIAQADEKARKASVRTLEANARADEKARREAEKEAARLYGESRAADAVLQQEELEEFIERLENILVDTLSVDDYLDLETIKKPSPSIPAFSPGELAREEPEPSISKYLPKSLTSIQKLNPFARKKFEEETRKGYQEYDRALKRYQEIREVEEFNSEIDEFRKNLAAADPASVARYFTMVLEASDYPEGFPQRAKLAYVPESKQIVVEYDLPAFEIVPKEASFKYVKTKDEITSTDRPLTKRKALYASITAQVALRTIHEIFEADRTALIDVIVFSGFVNSIDRATGKNARTCLISVRTTRDAFNELDLSKVDPLLCLKRLSASVSPSPDELAPVRPILELNMVDSRFIEEVDVLSTLDQRPNLMDLTPSEFESLITNLFAKMGLETRLTQASRDGGVDCVAFDPRPIFGGKVVIQAKRYKHTVGVSAVRDLYGTMQNEGASKGILVTTSGYGKAAFEFADGKPLELLSGSNLLYLLAEHAGIEAKIVVPDEWKDPHMDVEGD